MAIDINRVLENLTDPAKNLQWSVIMQKLKPVLAGMPTTAGSTPSTAPSELLNAPVTKSTLDWLEAHPGLGRVGSGLAGVGLGVAGSKSGMDPLANVAGGGALNILGNMLAGPIGGIAAQGTGVAAHMLAQDLGNRTAGVGDDVGTQAYLAYHPSGEALRTQRRGGPTAAVPVLEQYIANKAPAESKETTKEIEAQKAAQASGASSTMSPVALQQSVDMQKHDSMMTKLMSMNADVEALDETPATKQMIRGSLSKELINRGFQDPMLLGMWVQHGSDAFEKLRAIQEQNKKQSGGLSFAERMGMQAGQQEMLRGKQEEAMDQDIIRSFAMGARTKNVDIVKMAKDMGLSDVVKNSSWWNKYVKFTADPAVDMNLLIARLQAGHKPVDVVKAAIEARDKAAKISRGLGVDNKDQEQLDAVLNQ